MPKDEWGNIVSENEYYGRSTYTSNDEWGNIVQRYPDGSVKNDND